MTQNEKILSRLKIGRKITSLVAFELFGCLRLGARIWELRKQGHDIKDCMKKTRNGKWVKKYWMEK